MPPAARRRKGRFGTGRRDWLWVVTLLIVGAAVVFFVVVAISGGSEASQPIAGIRCERGERLEYHIHVRLAIFIEGQQAPVPGNIGSRRGCIYWLHTHEGGGQEGLIHVESPSEQAFTLGQFFQVWGKPLSSTQLLDRVADGEHQVRATIGTRIYDGDPAAIPLEDETFITLEFGPPFRDA